MLMPELKIVGSAMLNKRPTAMHVTPEGEIVVADKFGDVFTQVVSRLIISHGDHDKPKPLGKNPILGHVSMLHALTLVPRNNDHGVPHPLIVTADLDEHIRVSHFPKGHVIDKYLWGAERFVSALAYIPGNDEYPEPLIIAGGGDPTLKVFELTTGKLRKSFDIAQYLEPYITVLPEKAKANKTNGASRKLKGKARQQNGEGEAMADGEEEDSGDEPAAKVLAVTKIIPFGKRDSSKAKSGVLVVAEGCTAVLYIPNTLLGLSHAEDIHETSLVDIGYPVMDIFPTNPTVTSRFWVTYDPSDRAAADHYMIRQIHYSSSGRALLLDPSSESVEGILTADNMVKKSKEPFPLLYPLLNMLQNAAQEKARNEEDEDDAALADEAQGGSKKRKADGSPAPDPSGRSGKRAAARAETQRRLQEQREKQSVIAAD
ncbi:tRNA (guanine-N(7)-)-methyltransferase non-catalytic subunit trm82 [Microbotryomycetes sp. JL201]|nr:tRNA (guanine-N(7)-)-methyltransferase non-catalytic subunit trm82 [Microbotryomycetes sp. JL201]